MADNDLKNEFVRELINSQDSIYAYIMTLVPTRNDADDVLQQTNTVLFRKADQFPEIANFRAWACRVAYFEVLAYRTRHRRDRVLFDDRLVELLAEEVTCYATGVDQRQNALRRCLALLSDSQRQLVMKRYSSTRSVQSIADELGRPVGSIYQTLYRIRVRLQQCIQQRLTVES